MNPEGSQREHDWDSKPRRLVSAAVLFAAGAAFVVYRLDLTIAVILIAGIAALRVFGIQSKHLLWAGCSILLGMANAAWRTPVPEKGDISRYAGQSRYIKAIVEDCKPNTNGDRLFINVRCLSDSGRLQIIASKYPPVKNNIRMPKNELGSKSRLNRPAANKAEPREESDESSPIQEGDLLAVRGKIVSSECNKKYGFRNIGLARKGIFCSMRIRLSNLRIIRHKSNDPEKNDPLGALRKTIIENHTKILGKDKGELLSSMVLGDKAVLLDTKTAQEFRAAGLSHILAASGFNLSLVSAAVFFMLKPLLLKTTAKSCLCFLGMLFFVLLAGPSPSVLRAFIMVSLVLLSHCLTRSLHMPAALSATMLLVLIFDPWSLSDLSFQLSYLSTAGMILGAGKVQSMLKDKHPSLPLWLCSAIAATLAAQAYVLPPQLLVFRELTPYCLPANIMVLPAVPAISILGFASSVIIIPESILHLSTENSLAAFIDRIADMPLSLVRATVSVIAQLPFSTVKTSQTSSLSAAFYFLILSIFPVLEKRNQLKLWLFLFVLALLGMLIPASLKT